MRQIPFQVVAADLFARTTRCCPSKRCTTLSGKKNFNTKMTVCGILALRDYRLLLAANISEFCGSTLAELALLIFLYDATASAMALGGLGGAITFFWVFCLYITFSKIGCMQNRFRYSSFLQCCAVVVNFFVQIHAIPLGGVLADEMV